MTSFIDAIESESARFLDLIRSTPMATEVPSCPDWTVADLAWHLLEVQYFWANIVAGPLTSPESIPDLDRPTNGELPSLFEYQSHQLVTALRAHDPHEECWSWHDLGHSVGWVARRQAHEALIHRVDADLAAGQSPSLDARLAADGIDELLRYFLDSSDIPDWSSFEPSGAIARLRINVGASWTVETGRFSGTSPDTGNTYDDPALLLVDGSPEPNVIVTGRAADLDLWLWGRAPIDALEIEGDASVVAAIRAAAVVATQ